MSDVIYPSKAAVTEPASPRSDGGGHGMQPAPDTLAGVRVAGGVSIGVERSAGVDRISNLSERDGYKVRFARRASPPEAIIINTGGGLASGDRIRQQFDIAENAALTVTTQASERSYRSNDGATTKLDVHANVGRNASLNWLPQETILFDKTRLARSINVAMSASSRVVIAETLVFGRAAMGEKLVTGLFTDNWAVRRDGQLAFAERLHLDELAYQRFATQAISGDQHANGGTRVSFTVLLLASDAEDRLQPARNALADAQTSCAATAWDGKLIIRGLAERTDTARHLVARLLPALGARPVPRVWWT